MFSQLNTLSPLDGRYRKKMEELIDIFSEKSLFHYRVCIEVGWLKMLASIFPEKFPLSELSLKTLDSIHENFSEHDA